MRRLITAFAVTIAGFAVPAASQPGIDEANAAAQRAVQSCHAKLKAGQFRNRVSYAQCLNRANAKSWRLSPDWDLFQIATAKELDLARRFDRGGMTESEYQTGREQLKSELLATSQLRHSFQSAPIPPPPPIVIAPTRHCWQWPSGRITC